ncbi:MAG TPA: CBS domain-containing protein [Stenomitos sp.]
MMPLDQPSSWAPNLEAAIEQHPLIVSPTTSLFDAITLMSQAYCQVSSLADNLSLSDPASKENHASCVLVVEGQTLIGILTERDVVRLSAKTTDFEQVLVADVMAQPVITLPQRALQDIFAALFLFRRYRIRHLPIVDDHGLLMGVISHESIRKILRPFNLLRLRRVSDVMTTQAIRAPLSSTILDLVQLMAEHRVSCVVITQQSEDDNEQPIGIVTERDVVQFQAFQIDLGKTQAQTVMSTPLFLLSPEDSLWTAHQEMQRRHVGRLVVSWNWGQGLGIVTQTSLLRVFDPMEMYCVIENLQQTIRQLEAERKSVNDGDRPDSLPITQDSQTSFKLQNEIVQDRSIFSWLDSASCNIKHMLANPDLDVERRHSILLSSLEALEQLNHKMTLPPKSVG